MDIRQKHSTNNLLYMQVAGKQNIPLPLLAWRQFQMFLIFRVPIIYFPQKNKKVNKSSCLRIPDNWIPDNRGYAVLDISCRAEAPWQIYFIIMKILHGWVSSMTYIIFTIYK